MNDDGWMGRMRNGRAGTEESQREVVQDHEVRFVYIHLGSARRRPYPYCGDYYDYHRDASINGAVRRSPNGTINPDNQLSAVDRTPVPVSLLRFSMLIALAAQLGSPNSSATVCGGESMCLPEGRA